MIGYMYRTLHLGHVVSQMCELTDRKQTDTLVRILTHSSLGRSNKWP